MMVDNLIVVGKVGNLMGMRKVAENLGSSTFVDNILVLDYLMLMVMDNVVVHSFGMGKQLVVVVEVENLMLSLDKVVVHSFEMGKQSVVLVEVENLMLSLDKVVVHSFEMGKQLVVVVEVENLMLSLMKP